MAWAWEIDETGDGEWITAVSKLRPADKPFNRNIRPLYASPPLPSREAVADTTKMVSLEYVDCARARARSEALEEAAKEILDKCKCSFCHDAARLVRALKGAAE